MKKFVIRMYPDNMVQIHGHGKVTYSDAATVAAAMIKSVAMGCEQLTAEDLIEIREVLIDAQNTVTEKIKEKTKDMTE